MRSFSLSLLVLLAGGRFSTSRLAIMIRRAVWARQSLACRLLHTQREAVTVDDPYCDPNNPRKLSLSDVSVAHHRIKSGIIRTDCRYSRYLSHLTKSEVFLKMEVNQFTGSFKERGARFALMNMSEEDKRHGVFAASAGNHALALSIHGKKLGIPVTVIMPRHAPLMKITKCQELGSNVIVEGKDLVYARQKALTLAKESGGKYINGYDHIDILAGAGTVGIEIIDQIGDVDAILVPTGGCGLLAGLATAVKGLAPQTKIISLVPETCPSFKNSLAAGKIVTTKCEPTLADGLAVPIVGVNAFHSCKDLVDEVVEVKERDIARAIVNLIEGEKVICEGAGAISTAALIYNKMGLEGKRVVCILSGGNIDTTVLGRCLDRGLSFDDRLIKFSVVVSDRPGGVAELTQIIATTGASIKDIFCDRTFLRQDVFSVRIKIIAETRGKEHGQELETMLKRRYADVDFRKYGWQVEEDVASAPLVDPILSSGK